ncbi:triose-phosphate transporter family-domain-containing protein [Pilobolus umbonatus]|nr:triose-phosphate transporter family-domain-containing protein [Pilobolus umbonatus]
MIKSSTPVWVLLFSILFGLKRPQLHLIVAISIIVLGVFLTIDGESHFDSIGFILVSIAAIMSGLRWTMTQLLMSNGHSSPIVTLYHMSPVMFITMFTLSLVLEDPFRQTHLNHFNSIANTLSSLGLMSIGGILAFIMTLAEFYFIKNTSTVTLSVAGISKEIIIIALSVFLYGDRLTAKTYSGLFISIMGIFLYNYYRSSPTAENNEKIYSS